MRTSIKIVIYLTCFFAFSQHAPNTFRYVDLNTFKWGIKDFSGKTIVEPKYSEIRTFRNGRYVVYNASMKQGMIDEAGNEILPTEYFSIYDMAKDTIILRKGGRLGIVNSCLEPILPIKYKYLLKEKDFYIVAKDFLMGILDADFKVATPFIYSSIYHPSTLKNPHLLVYKNEKRGVIDMRNNVVIPIEHDYLELVTDFDYYLGENENQSTIYDLSGNIIFSVKSNGIKILSKDRFAVKNKENLWGVFDIQSNQKIDYKYKQILPSGENFYIAQNSHLQWGALDDNDNVIIPFLYLIPFVFKGEAAIVQNMNGKYGFIDRKGGLIADFRFDSAIRFGDNDYILVKSNNKAGLRDKNGKKLLETIYDFINGPRDNFVVCGKNKMYNFIRLDQPISEKIKEYDYIQGFMGTYDKDLILVKKEGLYGFIDFNGNLIIPAIYENARPFTDNFASVKLKNETFIINKKGHRLPESK